MSKVRLEIIEIRSTISYFNLFRLRMKKEVRRIKNTRAIPNEINESRVNLPKYDAIDIPAIPISIVKHIGCPRMSVRLIQIIDSLMIKRFITTNKLI